MVERLDWTITSCIERIKDIKKYKNFNEVFQTNYFKLITDKLN